ncbi:aminodeoxychorismate/anthranilate synthase component II [Ruminiclostridium herbifermentans]|uniref:Aminodeoxychorismate/anthranilate synthase component II n=1 Tax=Ruminiclostridium herbifermentans TaxID=2488810 RepID=A0A4U7JJC1_9FIRM|nr:aminodeoxychorismate/anthranilate synthase component II [Ruminiclostridium herbifermentans]QNU66115.1 aminodeoxychorismate/anthranilate synthase component II [Ruminiclostridium herbifermentans]
MLLIIDNYDSFTYNLYQYIGEVYPDIVVKRNDEITIQDIYEMKPMYIVISPGPGYPEAAGISVEVIKQFSGKIPILGICLGHQAICIAMGGIVGSADAIVHGKQSRIYNDGEGIFKYLPKSFNVVRYHSLCAKWENFPKCLEVQAVTEDNTIMAFRHRKHHTYGLQFHPESILSEYGKELLMNFLDISYPHYEKLNCSYRERVKV